MYFHHHPAYKPNDNHPPLYLCRALASRTVVSVAGQPGLSISPLPAVLLNIMHSAFRCEDGQIIIIMIKMVLSNDWV